MATGPRQKLWLERDGQIVMSDYRVRLLREIDRHGSLVRAAAESNLSYRRAWGKVRELEANLGTRLVHSEVGGAGGGCTTLTPEGRALIDAYERFQARVAVAVCEIYEETVAPTVARMVP